MAILPVQLLAPAAKLAGAAGNTAVATGSSFAGLLKSALQRGDASGDSPSEAREGLATGVFGSSGSIQVSQLRRQTSELLQSFHGQLVQLLSANGIDVSDGVHFQGDEFGQVRVAGDHPRKRDIESVLASHPEVEEAFREISARTGLLHAIDSQDGSGSPDDQLRAESTLFDLFINSQRSEVTFLPGKR